MVYTELNHNPYMMKTTVSFNGQAPKINCQIEKYENQTLTSWMSKIPQILYNEMNGYDFDLNFTGTRPDFENLCKVFEAEGVSKNDVRIYLKNELEDAETKCAEIAEMLDWMKAFPNRRIDWEKFWDKNRKFFEEKYPYIMIRGQVKALDDVRISAESVNSATELKGTDLTETPILVCTDESTAQAFREDIVQLLNRDDVKEEQLFFWIHPEMNREQLRRVIVDLGISSPQIVFTPLDDKVLSYIRNFPMTTLIRNVIKFFEIKTLELSKILEAENQESMVANQEIYKRIEVFESQIAKIRQADLAITRRDNLNAVTYFVPYLDELQGKIGKWRNRKTKAVGDQEIELAAQEFCTELTRYETVFAQQVENEVLHQISLISKKLHEVYGMQGMETAYFPGDIELPPLIDPSFRDLKPVFLALKEETYEVQKNDLFGFLAKGTQKGVEETVRTVTCYYEQWRSEAAQQVLPVVKSYIEAAVQVLETYSDALSLAYHEKLMELLAAQTEAKDVLASQLSDEERKLQEDNDWLAELMDRLHRLERG